MVSHDPTSVYTDSSINHPDHQAVGHATLNAIYPTARDRLNFPDQEAEGLEPHKVREVYLWGSREPNTWIDIGESFDCKVEALTHHKTQIAKPEEMKKGSDIPIVARERPRTLAAARQQKAMLAGEKMKQEGGVKHRSIVSSLDVTVTEFGAYDAAIIAAVQNRWYDLVTARSFGVKQTWRNISKIFKHRDLCRHFRRSNAYGLCYHAAMKILVILI